MKRTIHLGTTLLRIFCLFAAVSLRAQSPEQSTFSLSPGDVTEAMIGASGVARLQVTLTQAKSAELLAFTSSNLNQKVRIVVGGKSSSEPFIRERIAGPL